MPIKDIRRDTANRPGRPRRPDRLDRLLLPHQARSFRATESEIRRLERQRSAAGAITEIGMKLKITIDALNELLTTARREWGL